jgi:hypothetical protein
LLGKSIIRAGLDALTKTGSKALLQGVQHYNKLVLGGDIERAKAEIKVEFMKNRQVATRIYQKYKDQMEPGVREIYEEMLEQEDRDG